MLKCPIANTPLMGILAHTAIAYRLNTPTAAIRSQRPTPLPRHYRACPVNPVVKPRLYLWITLFGHEKPQSTAYLHHYCTLLNILPRKTVQNVYYGTIIHSIQRPTPENVPIPTIPPPPFATATCSGEAVFKLYGKLVPAKPGAWPQPCTQARAPAPAEQMCAKADTPSLGCALKPYR